MSENKTRVPGVDPDERQARRSAPSGPGPQMYSRSEQQASRGTRVPGMMGAPGGSAPEAEAAPHQPSGTTLSGKPVVGFLYSVSRTPVGEFWPLHVGSNSIGQSPDCEIMLPEGTVSARHATLVVRKMKKPEKIIASITDSQSTNGTMLNGESLGFEPTECKNGDIITIGDNYELFLTLIDTAALGLKVSENFIGVEMEEEEDIDGPIPFIPGSTHPGTNPYSPGSSPYSGTGGTSGTVGLDGVNTMKKGGTEFM